MPPAFCHPLPNEIVIGTIYGIVALLAVIRCDVFSWRGLAWMVVIVASGLGMLRVGTPLFTGGVMVPLNQLFVLGMLAGSCRFAAELNRRLDQWNQPDRNRLTRQFSIGGLLWLTTCFAIAMLLAKQTTLIDRSVIYWAGLFVFLAIFSFAFSRHPIALLFAAGLLAFVFAIVDARGVQPGDLEFRSAVIRYAGLLFGMIWPRLVFNEHTMGRLTRFFNSHVATDEPTTLTQDFDDAPAHFQRNDCRQADIDEASVGPTVARVTATDEAEPTLRIVY